MKCSIIPGYVTSTPKRGSKEAAGVDIYVPAFNTQFIEDFKKANIGAGVLISNDQISVQEKGRVVIPSGLRFNIAFGEYLEVANRGGIASREGLVYGAHIIDSDYQGNVFINLINTSRHTVKIIPGQKVAQILHKYVIMDEIEMVDNDTIYTEASERGEGSRGSTD